MPTVDRDQIKLITTTEFFKFRNNVQVPPEKIDENNSLSRARYNTLAQFVIESVVSTTETNEFTEKQTFKDSVVTNLIENIVGNDDILIDADLGTIILEASKLYKNDKAVAENEILTKLQVDQLIAALTGTSYDLIDGGIQDTDFTAVSNNLYFLDASSNDIDIALPDTPGQGTVVGFINYNDSLKTTGNVINIYTTDGENVQNEAATVGDPSVITNFYAIYLQFDSTLGWIRL